MLAQDAGKISPQSKYKTEAKKEVKKNGPQPVRYNQKRLASDPNSPFYDPTYREPTIDNVQSRFEFDLERLKDPSTGEIPDNIRQRELEFALSSPKFKLQNDPGRLQLRSGEPAPRAAGDQESAWVNRGPYNIGGRTRALAIDLDDENIILAGGVSGGMWRTTNQGTSWTKVTASEQHPGITDVVQDPRAGFHDTWYYSTGERIGSSESARNGAARYAGKGIYKSTDNGLTWVLLTATQNLNPQFELLGENPFAFIFGLDIHPTTGDLYVATFHGIQRSTDGGTTFTEVLPADLDNHSDIHIASDGVIYAALDNGRRVGGIFRTTDGAPGTWVEITAATFPSRFGRTVIYSSPSSPEILYILASGTPRRITGHDFWKYTYVSEDGSGAGGRWENRSANLPAIRGIVGSFDSQRGYDLYVRVHPTDPDFVLIGGTNMYRSTDGFATQATITSWVGGYSPLNNVSIYSNHFPDQHSLEFFPSNPDKVISGHDGGISITTDITTSTEGAEPVAWTSLNNGYLTTQVYALSIGPTDQLMAGFQDNSTWFTNNTTPTDPWVDLYRGDGSYNAFNSTGELRYVSSQRGNIRRIRYADANSTTQLSSTRLTPVFSNNDFFLFVAPFELDPNDDEIMYLAQNNRLWRNDDLPNATSSLGWTELTNASTPRDISSIGISESPANVVYIGTTRGQVYRIDNANVGNPASIDVFSGKGLPRGGNVASIDVNPFNSDDVVIAFSNYSIISVFHSTDGGSTWENISGNLEEYVDGTGAGPSVRWVASVGNRDRYFAGTSTGLYSTVRLDGTRTVWTQEDLAGIKNTVVEQIRTRDSDGLVVIGTHGNGLYSGSFETSVPPVVVANAINDLVVEVNSADMQVDVSNIFVSNESPPLPVTVSVESNSNSALVTATVSENSLTLSYLPGAFGKTTITLRGEDANTNFALTNFSIRVNPPPVTTFPYTQNFENGLLPLDWEKSGSMAWIIHQSETPSPATGPGGDNTLMNVIGSYIYSEASDHNEGDEAVLLTRKIDLRGLPNPFVEFAYHMYGSTMGTLKVEVLDVTDSDPVNHTETQEFTVSGQQQEEAAPYLTTKVDLSAFSSSIVRLKFTSVRGDGFYSDVALDDISVKGVLSDDLEITKILSAPAILANEPTEVTIEITNVGTQSQSGFNVSYQIRDKTIVTETFAGTIDPETSVMYTFTTPYMEEKLGDLTYDVSADLVGEGNTTNNQLQFEGVVLAGINTFPYAESFEAGNGSWFANGVNNSFELGTPDDIYIDAASEGTQAWVTDLDRSYNNYESSYVISPIFDFTALVEPTITLDINYIIEARFDGAILQSSIDFGRTWENVGAFEDLVNWYNYQNQNVSKSLGFASTSFDSWSGNSMGYVTASHGLDGLGGESDVILRVVFGSDRTVINEGFSFDNVKIVGDVSSLINAPTNLTAEGSKAAEIVLNWTDNADNEVDFVIERADDGTTFTELATTVANVTTYTDASAIANISYSYRVAARNARGISAYSNTAESIILSTPFAPSSLTAEESEAAEIVLNWTDNADNEVDFVIERADDGTTFTELATTLLPMSPLIQMQVPLPILVTLTGWLPEMPAELLRIPIRRNLS